MRPVEFSFKGLMAPVFTPFDKNGGLNLEVVPAYAKYLHDHGIKGVLVNGTTGEGVSMAKKERKEVLGAWVKACQPYKQSIMVQIGGTNFKDVTQLAKDAENKGVSSILTLADLFFKPSSITELIEYLKAISKVAPRTPLLYYHIPSFTGINLNMAELLRRSDEVPTLVGIKFTDVDLVTGTTCVSLTSKKHAVFLGCDHLFLPALIQGFDSAIGTTINMFPARNTKILEYFTKGDIKSAAAEQRSLNCEIQKITNSGPWVSSMKAAMRHLTPIDVGPVREPLKDVKNFEF